MTPERALAHLRYQLAAERAAGRQRDADLARLRAEVVRLGIAAGERQAPPPIAVPEPPPVVSRAAPPEHREVRRFIHKRTPGGWLLPFLREHGPMTAAQLVAASGRPLMAIRRGLTHAGVAVVRERTGRGMEVLYRARLSAAG